MKFLDFTYHLKSSDKKPPGEMQLYVKKIMQQIGRVIFIVFSIGCRLEMFLFVFVKQHLRCAYSVSQEKKRMWKNKVCLLNLDRRINLLFLFKI